MEITENERELLRTCVRWYRAHTIKQLASLRRTFGPQAETEGQEMRLKMLEELYERLSYSSPSNTCV